MMQTKEYTTVDKSSWPRGQWDNEPDKRQWPDPATGLPCLIVRHRTSGHLCGYVGVPPGHPMHGKKQDALNVEVHGGLTFANTCGHGDDESTGVCHMPDAGEPDGVWWFGFDCAHSGDLSHFTRPNPLYELTGPDEFGGYDRYRDFTYVAAECESLAAQLAAL